MSTTKSLAASAVIAAALSLLALSGVSHAQDQARARIYGSQLMTKQERVEHRAALRSLKTMEEREAYRLEHHKKMQERARERGVTLPETPPVAGGKGGPGGGPGGGRGR